MSTTLSRVAWIIPAFLLFLTVHQSVVWIDLGTTMREGTETKAEVTRYNRVDRKDITEADIDLRIKLTDGSILEKHRMSLPYTIAHRVEKDSLEVYVLPGSRQEVVIASIGGTQRRIALSNSVMAFIMTLIAGAGVFYWGRYQKSHPD